MKKLFTLGFVATSIAIAMVACTKNNSVNPTSSTKNLTTFIKKDTVTPPHASIAIRDTVTPPKQSFSAIIKRDTVTPPRAAIAIRDTVTPPRKP